MTTRGRKPKPAAQRRAEGNPGKRPIHDAWQGEGVPEPPAFLGPIAREEWDRVVPELVRAGLASRVSSGSLTALCTAWGIAEHARLLLDEEGLVEEGSTGQLVESPLVGTYLKAITTYMRIATEFGMTASAAMRVEMARGADGAVANPLSAIGEAPRLRAIKGGQAS